MCFSSPLDSEGRELSTEGYLARLGIPRDEPVSPDRPTLERLQRAHVLTVPFETFSIGGDPFGDRDGGGVSLSLPTLYEKTVDERRGGFCFELNGLFGWLLSELGFDVTRLAGRMVQAIEVPANHHPLLVRLDRPYVVDVGMGSPMLRSPIALGESSAPDDAGVSWRLVESDRPDADHLLQYRTEADEWADRYVFDTTPRSLGYFAATCEYLQNAPESGFTGDPVATMATPDGYKKLNPETFSLTRGGGSEERSVDADEYSSLLETEFDIAFSEAADPL
jgi:N-hydroxyarylamine O-acetyltransferase